MFCGGYDAAETPSLARFGSFDQNHSLLAVRYPPFATCAKDGATHSSGSFGNSKAGPPAKKRRSGAPTVTKRERKTRSKAWATRHSAVYDSATNTMIVFGGNDCFSTVFSDVWLLSNANGLGGTPTWTLLSSSGGSPAVQGHTAVYDPGANIMIVFGGSGTVDSDTNETWVLSNANGTGGRATWRQLSPTGTFPASRETHSAVYDAASNRMTVFGGRTISNGTDVSGPLNDAWILANANGQGGTPTWTQLGSFTLFAEARLAHTAVYNPTTNKMTIFGGSIGGSGNDIDTNDVWVLSHANGK